MAFAVHSLVRLLEERPEWRARLRRLLLSQGLLRLPRLVRQLSADVHKLQQATAEPVEAQKATGQRLQRLEDVVGELVGAVGAVKGENLERRSREGPASYLQRVLRRIRVLDHQQLGLLLDDALDQGHITPEERAQVLEADVVVAGLAGGREVYLLSEVSGTVTAHDARGARARAAALEKATGCPVLPAVAGQQLSDDRETQEEAAAVWGVLDGHVRPPSQTSSP